jgi:hypothetical protein
LTHDADAAAALGVLWPLVAWLEASALGVQARQSLWLYPIVSVAHILGLALLVGAIVAFDLRLLGMAQVVRPRAAGRLLLPLARLGLLLQLVSGVPMLAADATHLAINGAFQLKLLLIGVALLNIVLFHLLAGRELIRLEPRPGPLLRGLAAVSLLLWLGVAALGRFVAYV